MHLKDAWAILKENLWIVATCLVVIVSTVAIVSFSKTPMYQTSARVLIKARLPNIMGGGLHSVEDNLVPQSAYDMITFINSQKLVIRSTGMAERVLERFPHLREHPRFKNAGNPAAVLRSRVQAKQLERSHILDIIVVDSDPKLAADIANAVAETYASYNLEVIDETASHIYSILQEKLDSVRGEVEQTRTNLLGTAAETDVYNPQDIESINTAKLSSLSSAYTGTRTERIEKEVLMEQIREVERRKGDYSEIYVIAQSPAFSTLHSQLINLEIERASLAETYKEKHPMMQSHLATMNEVKANLNQEVQMFVKALKKEHARLKALEEQYFQALEKARLESAELNKQLIAYETSEREVRFAEDAYTLIFQRLKDRDIMDGLQMDIVSVLERATVPTVPFTPKIKLNILFSLLFSVFVSAGVVILKEYLDTTVRTPDDIEALKLPILSMIPHAAEGTGRSTAREAYNSLRTALLFSRGDAAHYTLLVTSTVPKEGKTSVTSSLGKTLASAGERVLMVDCDFRRPMLHNKFNIDRRKGGVASYVMQSESVDIETYIQNVAPNLDVLACGPIPPDPPKILGSQQFKDLLSRLKQRYRWVLLDSPPLLGLADSVVLSTICDGLCLVIRRNKVDKLAAQRCLGQMRDINVNVIGAVFNDLDFRSAYYTRYYRYGGGYYYYYYSSQEEKEKDSMMPMVERFRKRRRSQDAVSETFFDS